jgi:heme exporter protein C
LLFLYVGYMALQGAFDDRARGAKASAILALVGAVNLPIIKFSVDWWNTLHQPASVFKMGGPTIDASMLWPLFLLALAFKGYYIWVLLVRMREELTANKVRILRLKQAHGG